MAVRILEHWHDRGTQISDTGVVSRSRGYYAIATTPVISDFVIIEEFSTQTGIRRGTTWEGADGSADPLCRAVDLTANHIGDDYGKWEVVVTYTSGNASTGGGTFTPRDQRERAAQARRQSETGQPPSTNPTERPISISWGSTEYQEALTHDVIDTRAVLNSAGERFIPVPMRTLSIRTLTVEANFLQYDPVATWYYENTVNDAVWYGFPEKSVLCKSITAQLDLAGNQPYAKTTFVFWIRYPSWELSILDAGYNQLLDVLTPILDKYGQPVATPQLLDGQGALLTPGADPVFIEPPYNQYTTNDFTLLQIGGGA